MSPTPVLQRTEANSMQLHEMCMGFTSILQIFSFSFIRAFLQWKKKQLPAHPMRLFSSTISSWHSYQRHSWLKLRPTTIAMITRLRTNKVAML